MAEGDGQAFCEADLAAYLYPSLYADVGVGTLSSMPHLSGFESAMLGAYSQLILRGLPLDSVETETADGVIEAIPVCGKIYVKLQKCKLIFTKETIKTHDSIICVKLCSTDFSKSMLARVDNSERFNKDALCELYLSSPSPDAVAVYSFGERSIVARSYCPSVDAELYRADILRALIHSADSRIERLILDGTQYGILRRRGEAYLSFPITHTTLTSGE